jgi:putative transcriptional regulator
VTLKGRLLIALPVLRDPNFDRTVVYMLEHDADNGAVGVVLNRPSPLTVGEPLPDWAALAAEPAVVFVGGPVEQSGAIGLAEVDGLIRPVDLEAGPALIEGEVGRLRVFAGYAGWAVGQLEDELAAGAWIDVPARPDDLYGAEPDGLWAAVLKRQGGRVAAVAAFPEDPRVN